MLIIGHRGSRGTEPENTISSLREAMRADADMIEFDIRLTRDRVPVLGHDRHLAGTRKRELAFLRRYTLSQLRDRTADSEYPITTLEEAMTECYGKIYLNIEIKEITAVIPTLTTIKQFTRTKKDWDSILLSSFKPLALRSIRRRVPYATLGLLHYRNPLAFVGWHRLLNLSAVGFHRLYVSTVALDIAKRLGLFTYAYTVNRKAAAVRLTERGIDAIVTDYPAKMLDSISRQA